MTTIRNRISALSQHQILILVFVLAFLIRLGFLATKPHAWTHKLQAGDEPLYHGIAVSLATGKGYSFEGEPTARYGPGYPSFVAIIYRLVGVSPPAVRVANALLGSLLCLLIAWWAAILWGKQTGLIAGLASTFYYPFVQLPPYLMTENLYLPLFVAATMVTWAVGQRYQTATNHWLRAIGAGALWGLSALTRSIALPIAALTSLWLIVQIGWRQVALMVLVFLTLLIPWTVRNYLVFHALVPLQLSAGQGFYLSFGPSGTEPKVLGHWNWGSDVQRPQIPDDLSPTERDRWLRTKAWENIKSDPMGAVIKRIPRKLANLLTPFYGIASLVNKALSSLCYFALLLLAVPSVVRAWRSRVSTERTFGQLVLLIAAFTFAFHSVFYGVVRYRYPIDALLLIAIGGQTRKR